MTVPPVVTADEVNDPKARERRRLMREIRRQARRQAGMTPFSWAPRKSGAGSHWMAEVNAQREAKRALGRIKTDRLAPECPPMSIAAMAFPTALALASAETSAVRAVKGLGPVKRGQIRDYLASKGVVVAWEA